MERQENDAGDRLGLVDVLADLTPTYLAVVLRSTL